MTMNSSYDNVHGTVQTSSDTDCRLVLLLPSVLYLLYSTLEEEHGLARHAMAVYNRATKAVLPEEQFEGRVW